LPVEQEWLWAAVASFLGLADDGSPEFFPRAFARPEALSSCAVAQCKKIDILQWGQWGWDDWGWWGWWGFLRIYLIFIVFFKHLEGIKRDCTDAFAVLSAA
jgi:hypothetical protein